MYNQVMKDYTTRYEGPIGDVFTTDSHTESITDVVTPNYRSRIKDGAIINNPCSYSNLTLTSGSGYLKQKSILGFYATGNGQGITTWSGPVSQYYGGGFQTPVAFDEALSDLHKSAMSYAISQIDSSEFGFGEDIAEIRETLGFIRNPIKSIAEISKRHRKAAFKLARKRNSRVWHLSDKTHVALRAREVTRAMNDTFLTYRFAYTPLVKSMSDAVDALAYRTVKRVEPPRQTARGFATYKDRSDGFFDSDVWGYTYEHTEEVDASVSAQILYATTGIKRNSHGNILGLRVKDIPETVWAVMPYSFMVDRIVNVSQMIRGITNLSDPRITILAASVTQRIDQTRSFKLLSDNLSHPNYVASEIEGNLVEEHSFSYTRSVWNPSVVDTIGVTSLPNLVSDSLKIADLTSLILSRIL
jgi:hypothetical protein